MSSLLCWYLHANTRNQNPESYYGLFLLTTHHPPPGTPSSSASPCLSLAIGLTWLAIWCTIILSQLCLVCVLDSLNITFVVLCAASSQFSRSCTAKHPPQEASHGCAAGRPAMARSFLKVAFLTDDSVDRATREVPAKRWAPKHSRCGRTLGRVHTGSWEQLAPSGTDTLSVPCPLHWTAPSLHSLLAENATLPSPSTGLPQAWPSKREFKERDVSSKGTSLVTNRVTLHGHTCQIHQRVVQTVKKLLTLISLHL